MLIKTVYIGVTGQGPNSYVLLCMWNRYWVTCSYFNNFHGLFFFFFNGESLDRKKKIMRKTTNISCTFCTMRFISNLNWVKFEQSMDVICHGKQSLKQFYNFFNTNNLNFRRILGCGHKQR